MSNDDTDINYWATLQYLDPIVELKNFRHIERHAVWASAPPRVKRLRTGDLKSIRETRNAAIFTHGLARVLGLRIGFAPVEESDYDFVTSWVKDETRNYAPVQLKELVPEDLNPESTLEALFRSSSKYAPTRTVLAILINRPTEVPIADLDLEAVPFSEVWCFWQASADGSRWMLQGDVLGHSQHTEFLYPE